MEHGFPLARLARLVAESRTGGRTTRLVARNTERFGLIHLYFVHGRLAQVEGHAGNPLASIGDLASWRYGVVRQDASPNLANHSVPDPRLDAALDDTLRRLMASGIVQPISLPGSPPSTPSAHMPSYPFRAHASHASQAPHASPPPPHPPSIGSGALPPLARSGTSASAASASNAATKAARADALSTPQWQMVALVVHQVVEGAGALIGAQMVENLLRQALATASHSHPLLHELTLDTGGWLKEIEDGVIARYATYDVADAIAAVLTSFELRCGSLLSPERAQDVILVAAAPFRNALAQIGLDISA